MPFFFASGSEFDEVFLGLGPRRIRELFEEAKANAPSIVFIDEIDTLAHRRYFFCFVLFYFISFPSFIFLSYPFSYLPPLIETPHYSNVMEL